MAAVVPSVDVVMEVRALDADGRLQICDRFPPDRLPTGNRPDVRESRLDINPARPPGASLVYDHEQLVATLHHTLGLNPEAFETFEPAAEEPLEAIAATVHAPLRARSGFVPLDLRIEEIEDDREAPRLRAAYPRRSASTFASPMCGVHHAVRAALLQAATRAHQGMVPSGTRPRAFTCAQTRRGLRESA